VTRSSLMDLSISTYAQTGNSESKARNPRLGIVVPTLNSSATLDWTLCALRGQRDMTAEIIVADSGSEDGTLDICKKWGVPTFYVPPGNMYRAVNMGLRQMDMEWVAYMNSDDLVYPQSYARMLALAEQQRADAVYGDVDFVDGEGRFRFLVKAPPPSRLAGMFRRDHMGFQPAAVIFRRSVFQKLGGFDERYRLVADYDFFYRLTISGHKLARVEPPSVAAFRTHASQLSSRESVNMKLELQSFRKAMKVRSFPGDLFDVFCWRLQNSPMYFWRLMKQRP
jgi:glycosyltransferase involved in cell wall biosynthesis